MHIHQKTILPQALLALGALITYVPDVFALGSYGATVNKACTAFNGTAPYTGDCTLCHAPSPAPKSQRLDPAWTWWQNQLQAPSPLLNFCPPQSNQPPEGSITAPANNSTFNVGDSVAFVGAGSDPDGNTPLAYAWNFAGGATNSTLQNPTVRFDKAGTFTISLTVTDSLNRADPTPATITLIVNDPNANQPPSGSITTPTANQTIRVGESLSFAGTGTDPNNNLPLSYLWSFGGAAPDSTTQNPTIIFGTAGIYTATLTVTDSLGLGDPTPATRTITVDASAASACKDQDNDKFSPDGGVCGPIDCNDANAAVNPGVTEVCADNIDNDCDGNQDGEDAECKGSSCLDDLLKQVEITSATWDPSDRELKVKGYSSTSGASVKLSDAITGAVLGTTTVRSGGDEEEDEDKRQTSDKVEWRFELSRLAIVPCRVQAEINGKLGKRDVDSAPANCSRKSPTANRRPVANSDKASTTQGVAVNIAVLENDSDADNDKLSIVVFTKPKNGAVTRKGDILTYTSRRRFTGTDSFSYTLSDQRGGTAKANVTVTVSAGSGSERD